MMFDYLALAMQFFQDITSSNFCACSSKLIILENCNDRGQLYVCVLLFLLAHTEGEVCVATSLKSLSGNELYHIIWVADHEYRM